MSDAGRAIRDAVEEALPDRYRPLSDWSGPHARSRSWHFTAAGAGTPLIVKVPRWSGVDTLEAALAAGPQPDTEGEYQALVAIAEAITTSGDPDLTAVVPVVYARPVNAIVTEWLEAGPLRDWLGPRVHRAVTAPLLEAAGRWIGLHQSRGEWVTEPFDGRAAASGWTDLAAGRPPRRLMASLERLASAAERLDGTAVRMGRIHGDLSLANVLITSDGRIAVIGPLRLRGPSLADAARLGAELLVGMGRLITLGRAPGPSRARDRVASVMAGYGNHDAAMFSYELAAACARRWLALRRTGAGARLAGAFGGRLFEAEIARLTG